MPAFALRAHANIVCSSYNLNPNIFLATTTTTAPQVNTKQTRLKEALADAAMRDGELRDMQGQARVVRHRTRDFAKLHDLVKGQKNKFVNLVQVRRGGRHVGAAAL